MQATLWRIRALGFTVLLAATAALLSNCGGSNDLYGSISSTESLQYDSIVLGVQSSYLVVSYVRKDGELVAKLAIDTNGLSLSNGAVLTGDQFISNVTVTRVVTDGNTFPPVYKGTVTFNDYSTNPGSNFSGHFAIIFNQGDTLEGDFSGSLANQNTASAANFDATDPESWAIPWRITAPQPSRVQHASDAAPSALAGLFYARPPPG